jgi:hypothetical protein
MGSCSGINNQNSVMVKNEKADFNIQPSNMYNNSYTNTNNISPIENNSNLILNSSKHSLLISTLLSEVEMRKDLIRNAVSESIISDCLVDLAKNSFIHINKELNCGSIELNENNDSANCSKEFRSKIRTILVAYLYLIDNEYLTNYDSAIGKVSPHNSNYFLLNIAQSLTSHEMRILNVLQKMYASFSNEKSISKRPNKRPKSDHFEDEPMSSYVPSIYDHENDSFFNNSFSQNPSLENNHFAQSYGNGIYTNFYSSSLSSFNNALNAFSNHTSTTITDAVNISQIKMLHFLLLIQSFFVNIDEFMFLNSSNFETNLNCNKENFNDLISCQRIILQLVEFLCKENKSIKSKILLSVSEFDIV